MKETIGVLLTLAALLVAVATPVVALIGIWTPSWQIIATAVVMVTVASLCLGLAKGLDP